MSEITVFVDTPAATDVAAAFTAAIEKRGDERKARMGRAYRTGACYSIEDTEEAVMKEMAADMPQVTAFRLDFLDVLVRASLVERVRARLEALAQSPNVKEYDVYGVEGY